MRLRVVSLVAGFLLLIICLVFPVETVAQDSLSKNQLPDTGKVVHDSITANTDSLRRELVSDAITDSVSRKNLKKDSSSVPSGEIATLRAIKGQGPEIFFYGILLAALLLGILKLSFSAYFNNLFRVFFNTSLRQKQLTDQLLQSMWPSLLFNIFFCISGGMYMYLLMGFLGKWQGSDHLYLLPLYMIGIMTVYIIKFLWLKFLGWVSGRPGELNDYIFIVFLVNKMTGICLLPFLPVMAFSEKPVASAAVLLSVILIGFMVVVRLFRSYSLAASRMRFPVLHFAIYIIALELLPLLILLKLAAFLLNKNL